MPEQPHPVQTPRLSPTRPFIKAAGTALAYIFLCSGYIVVSSYIAGQIAETPQQLQKIETFKGVAFILITGILLFAISYVRWKQIRKQEDTLIKEETALLHAEKKLVAAMSAAMVAHDLNNLLMSLSGLLGKIHAQAQAAPELASMSSQIDVTVAKLRHLSRRLETSTGQMAPEKKEIIDMRAVILDIATVVTTHPDVRTCRIATTDIAPVILKLNRTLLEEAVLNLLINAAQATGPQGQIEVRLTTEPGVAILAVHDNGPGVPDFLVKDIFEPCFTTKPGGSGIGLLAVSAFAESCGGHLSIGRSPLGGALFQIRIPLQTHVTKPPQAETGAPT